MKAGWHDKVREAAKEFQTYAVLSRNCVCSNLRAFSGVIFPSFDAISIIFATAQS